MISTRFLLATCLLFSRGFCAPSDSLPDTPNLLRRSLRTGTPDEKEAALNEIRHLKLTALIPEVIEAIGDPTPLPRHGDTGWIFVGHQAATVTGEMAQAMDGIGLKTRGEAKYSFHDDAYQGGQKLKERGRLREVQSHWTEWWQAYRTANERVPASKKASLALAVQQLCETVSKNDYKAFCALVDDPDMAKQYGEKTWGETAFSRMKEIHAEEDYAKLFGQQVPVQKEDIEKGVFTLGGHAHGHLHIEMHEKEGAWRIARFRFCR